MNRRMKRVNQLLKEEVSRVIQHDLRDPRLRSLISVTHVETTPDMKTAKVYFSVLGPDERRDDARQGLNAAAGYIRKELGVSLPLRYVPSLSFVPDASLQLSEAIARAAAAVPEPSPTTETTPDSETATA